MSAEAILQRLRRFLLAFSVALFAGSLVELSFTGHTKEPVQWVPFILCGMGLLATGGALLRPNRVALLTLRGGMTLVTLGAVFGTYEHVANNLAFQLELHPDLTIVQKVSAALGGANPLLAPGILGVAALLSLAASYRHPGLEVGRRARIELIGARGSRLRQGNGSLGRAEPGAAFESAGDR